MPLPFAAQLAIAAAPTAIKLGSNLLRGDRQTPYQQELSSMADVFQEQATAPVSENRTFREGQRQLDRADEERRDRIDDASAATGATNESRLAETEQANEVYSDALNQLFGRAQQYRDQMQGRYLNILGQQEQARQSEDQRFQQRVNQFTQPLGQASQAFLLSNMFGDGAGGDTGVTPENTPPAQATGGPQEYGMFGGSGSAGYAA